MCVSMYLLSVCDYELSAVNMSLNQPIETPNDMLPCDGQRGLNMVIVPLRLILQECSRQ